MEVYDIRAQLDGQQAGTRRNGRQIAGEPAAGRARILFESQLIDCRDDGTLGGPVRQERGGNLGEHHEENEYDRNRSNPLECGTPRL